MRATKHDTLAPKIRPSIVIDIGGQRMNLLQVSVKPSNPIWFSERDEHVGIGPPHYA